MSDKLIQEKLEKAQESFDQVREQIDKLNEEVKVRQQQISKLLEEQVRLQGEYRVLNDLLEGDKEKKKEDKK